MLKLFIKSIRILVLILFSTTGIFAQNTFVLKGHIIDSLTNEPLPGATIKRMDSKEGVISDLEGNFIFTDIKNKNITLEIRFISYKNKRIKIELNNKSTELTIPLQSSTVQLEQVQVTGYSGSQAKALREQMNAVNIKNVISAKQISEFPDMNAAETLQRIPGITLQRDKGEGRFVQLRGTPPEYTNFNINGEQIPSPEGGVRYVGLDVISSDQIEFIEVSKVITPDMDADAIGGSVNIITKMARSESPEMSASVAAGYDNLRNTGNYQGQFSFSQRTHKLGISINANYYNNNQGADNMEFQYIKGPFWGSGSQGEGEENYHIQYNEIQLRHYNISRERIGLNATIDYQFNEFSKIYLRGMFNNFTDYETRRRVIYTLDDAVTMNYYLYGGIVHDLKDRTKIQNISSFNAGGNHKIQQVEIDYELSFSQAKQNEPDYLEIAFENPGQAIYMEIDDSDPEWPRVTFPNPENAENATNYGEYEFDEMRRENSFINDKNLTTKLNFKIPYFIKQNSGYIKFGGKIRLKEKERDIHSQIYTKYYSENVPGHTGTAPESLLTELYDGFLENNLMNHGYVIDYVPSPEKTRDFLEYYPQHFYLNKNETKDNTYSEDYLANENIYAAYAMFRHDIGKLMILGGLRYEYTFINYKGNRIVKDSRGNFVSLEDSVDKRENVFLLPQLQFKYSLNDRTNLRAAYTQTFSRPNFEDVLPYKNEERDNIALGNPELEFPFATNIDLLGETYGKAGQVFSGGLFYKKIDNYIYYYRIEGYTGDPSSGGGLKRIELPLNGKRAFVYGAELLSQFKFLFLPGLFKDFGLYLNYTYTYSEAYINMRFSRNEDSPTFILGESTISDLYNIEAEEKIRLPGQAKHMSNIALFYDAKKLYAKFSANYHDSFLHSLGEDKDLDEYYQAAWHLDFSANYQATPMLNVFVDVKNITNTPMKYYLNVPEQVLLKEYYSWWFRIGIKIELK